MLFLSTLAFHNYLPFLSVVYEDTTPPIVQMFDLRFFLLKLFILSYRTNLPWKIPDIAVLVKF